MTESSSKARWEGDLKSGKGTMTVGPDRWTGSYTFASRFEGSGDAATPEELLGAAHAGCFSMAFSNMAAGAGHTPESVETTAVVHLGKVDDKPAITKVALTMEASIPGMDEDAFQELAEKAKAGCPVSKLFDTEIVLDARLR
ncbi:MAG: OsmC family peroxiredoxin [Actinobacteria bacterium]|nr:OsmC family peroxiredoxin [Actinomycetota bacterium]